MSELLTIGDDKDKTGCGMFSRFGRFSSELLSMGVRKRELDNATKKRVFKVQQRPEKHFDEEQSEEDSLNGRIIPNDISPTKKALKVPIKTAIERAAAEEQEAQVVAKQPTVGSAMKLTSREQNFYGREFGSFKKPGPSKYDVRINTK